MSKNTASMLLVVACAFGAAACTSTPEQGPVENAAQTAGRVVDDSVITAKVKAALVGDEQTKAHQINVETFQGTVQLSGFVDSEESRNRAVEVARNIEGVQNVKNAMQIRDDG